MELLRTPEERFRDLPGYPFEPNYVELEVGPQSEMGPLRMHYVDEGPSDGSPVLMLHGEPSWSYLYRKMIPPIAAAGYRALAPDLVGFGRSDKPADRADYSYRRHVEWVRTFIQALDLNEITLFCQDWGGLIGLRIAAEEATRFVRVVAANTFLPTGEQPAGQAFLKWREFSQTTPSFDVGRIIQSATVTQLSDEVVAAYDAPFPDESYKEGARVFPALVPISPDDPGAAENKAAWTVWFQSDMPLLTAFSDSDPITRGGDALLQATIPGAKGQAHTTIEEAGHFLQEDKGEELAQVVLDFIEATTP